MKRFFVFCIICVVTVCMGLMTFRFLTLEETLSVNKTSFEINKGETVPLEIIRENVKPNTIITYESLDPEIVEYDYVNAAFKAKGLGGKARLRISSSIKNTTPILISVTVGDGSEASPYFIKTAYELAQIGVEKTIFDAEGNPELDEGGNPKTYVERPLDAYYSIVSDLDLIVVNEGEWTPIGTEEKPFTGVIYGNNHKITGLNVSAEQQFGGIFGKIDKNSKFAKNISGGLYIENAKVVGGFDYAGVLCGSNNGMVEKVFVKNAEVSSTKENAIIGGFVGLMNGTAERISVENSTVSSTTSNAIVGGLIGKLDCVGSTRAILDRSYAKGVNVEGNNILGGLVGLSKGGVVINTYAKSIQDNDQVLGQLITDSTNSTVTMGGMVGRVEITTGGLESYVVNGYSTVKLTGIEAQNRGQLIGYVEDKVLQNTEVVKNQIFGLYYNGNSQMPYGLGYIKSLGKVNGNSVVETSNYEFIYSDLDASVEEARATDRMISYVAQKGGNTFEFVWNTNCVWTIEINDYPTLKMDGSFYDIDEIISATPEDEAHNIKTANDLLRLKYMVNTNSTELDYSKPYVIRKTAENNGVIDLTGLNWDGIGTEEHPFAGTLTCECDENGNALVKIIGLTADVTDEQVYYATDADKNIGLFGVVGGKGKVSNIYVEDPMISSGQSIGVIAGKNQGVVVNCTVATTAKNVGISAKYIGVNTAKEKKDEIYVGGIVGFNSGTVSNCKVEGLLIQALNSNNNTKMYIGGVVGYNTNTVENSGMKSNIQGSNMITTTQNCQQYLGGVAGYNGGNVVGCYFTKHKVSETDSVKLEIVANQLHQFSVAGGVVAYNDRNGKISKSYVVADISGNCVGGIAGYCDGQISESYSVSTLTGNKVGGLVYSLEENGRIDDCYTNGMLSGISSSSEKGGFAYNVALNSEDNRTASIHHCFSSNNFDSNGKNYYDVRYEYVTQTVRIDDYWFLLMFKYERGMGYVVDCIFDYSVVTTNAIRTNKYVTGAENYDWRSCDKVISDYNSNKAYYSYQEDTGLNTEQIMSEDGTKVFIAYGFDTNIWSLDGYPTLKNVPIAY